MSDEIWRDIYDLRDRRRYGYQVSNLGRVRSQLDNASYLTGEWHILTPSADPRGRLVIRFSTLGHGRREQQFLDLLVMRTFRDCVTCKKERPGKPCNHFDNARDYTLEHIDGDPANCALENLRWTLTKHIRRRQ